MRQFRSVALGAGIFFLIVPNVLRSDEDSGDLDIGGYVAWSTMGPPAWSAPSDEADRSAPGDLLILRIQPRHPDEHFLVAAFMEYQHDDGSLPADIDFSKFKPVGATRRGRRYGYESRRYKDAVCVWQHLHADERAHPIDVALFLPYGACDLPQGNLLITYRLRLWSHVGEAPANDLHIPLAEHVKVERDQVLIMRGIQATFDESRPFTPGMNAPFLHAFDLRGTGIHLVPEPSR